jgi:hypothetical protein
VWSLKNLLKVRRDPAGQALVKNQLESWQHDFPDPNIGRWITEALTVDGPPPGRLVVDFVMSPDGKIRQVDPSPPEKQP